MLVATIVGTGVGVCALVLTLHGNIREDLRAVQNRIQGLDDRVREVEIAIAGGGQNQAGGGGSVALTPGNAGGAGSRREYQAFAAMRSARARRV